MYSRFVRYFLLALTVLALCTKATQASHIQISFAEMAQASDLIFIGTVESQTCRINDSGSMIFTDVVFSDVEIVNATDRSAQRASSSITLTFPGGTVGGLSIHLSCEVRPETGHRYLLFAFDDGTVYTSPLIGGQQGFFEVVRDTQTSEEFVLTAGGRAVVGFDAERTVASHARVAAIEGGRLVASPDATGDESRESHTAPQSADGETAITSELREADTTAIPLSLGAFVAQIRDVALTTVVTNPVRRRGDGGEMLTMVDGHVVAAPLKRPAPNMQTVATPESRDMARASRTPEVPRATLSTAPAGKGPGTNGSEAVQGGALGACGYQQLPIVMEQYPASWVEWQIANDCMYTWNQARDVFRYVDDDGSFGHNGVNEFCGYPTNAELLAYYDMTWNPDFAGFCWTSSYPDCGEILESDVFLNPAYSWTADPNVVISNPDVVLIRPLVMHELGHAWGDQLSPGYPETYDYDRHTVMHGDVGWAEDGWGLHAVDAYLIRVHYGPNFADGLPLDVGVESCYASNGLNESTISGTSFRPGDPITLGKVTVDNISRVNVSDVRIRFFLSSDRIITTGDYQMGSHWSWGTFFAETDSVFDYAMTIPSGVPNGSYYVGAIVTINGFNGDSYPWNDVTFFKRMITVSECYVPQSAPIAFGETINGSIDATDCRSAMRVLAGGNPRADRYTFEGVAGQQVSISMSSSTFDTFLYLLDDAAEEVMSDDDGGGGTNSRIPAVAGTFTLPHTGTFIIEATGYSTNSAGNYTIALGECYVPQSAPIAFGETINGSIDATDCRSAMRVLAGGNPRADRYTFEGVAGQQVSISMSSSTFDTFLYLLDDAAEEVMSDDDGGGVSNSRIPAGQGMITLPYTGIYIIEATSYFANRTGAYTITLGGDMQPPSITCPAPTTVAADANCSAPIPDLLPLVLAQDDSGAVTLAQVPAADTVVGLGQHTITVTATDGAGNSTSCSTTLSVVDATPPTITCSPNLQAVAASSAGAVVTYATPAATDTCSGVTVSCTPASGSTFPVGVTTVTCTATDGAGNTASCSFTVTVAPPAELIANGDFEAGAASWTQSPSTIITSNASEPAHLGAWKAKLLGQGRTGSASLSQAPAFPATGATRTLSFYLRIVSAETSTAARDMLYVRITNASGATLRTLATFSNAQRSVYANYAFVTLTVPAGYTVQGNRLRFYATENSSRATTFFVDDVSIQ